MLVRAQEVTRAMRAKIAVTANQCAKQGGTCGVQAIIERGVDIKVIAQWQGHRDSGVLILRTYSHVRPEHSNRMAQLMIDELPENVVPIITAQA